MLFKMALREIKKISRFHFFFLISLSLGMTGIIIVKNFKFSIEKTINQKSKKFLGADLALSLITPFNEDDLKKVAVVVSKRDAPAAAAALPGGDKTQPYTVNL